MTQFLRLIVLFLLLLSISFSSYSMEFKWGQIEDSNGFSHSPTKEAIYMTGDIHFGDYDRFRTFVLKDFQSYLNSTRLIYLSSNGGDIIEAVKIARLLKEMYAEINVLPGTSCASACFLLYVSAVERSSYGKVGIHRPYFERRYFAGLTPSNAEKRQLELTKVFNDFLEQNYVPRYLIDRINATSSVEIYWLTDADFDEVGVYSNWFEEFLLAKCKHAPDLLDAADLIVNEEKEYSKFRECKEKAIRPELKGPLRRTLAAHTR